MENTKESYYKPYSFITDKKYVSDFSIDERININTAYFGSGKTQSIINHYRETKQTIIFIHPTRALISDVSERLRKEGIEIKTHLDLNQSGDLETWTGNIDTTIESLIKIDFNSHKDSLFILDEFSTILSQVFSSINNDRQVKIFETLRFILGKCKVCIFDSLLQDFEIDLILELAGLKPDSKDLSILSNSNYKQDKREINIFYSEGNWERTILDEVGKDKRILLMIDNKAYAERLSSIIPNSIVLSSDSRGEILKDRTIKELIEKERPSLLAITPTGFTGLDIPKNSFDSVFIFSDNIAIKDFRVYIQAIHRLRDYSKPLNIFSKNFTFDPSVKTDYLDILKDYESKNKNLNRMSIEYLNSEGYWETKPAYRVFEVFLAKKESWINQNILDGGLSKFIESFYSEYGFKINRVFEESEKAEKPDTGETREEKKERLKAIPLIDKKGYDSLIYEQAKRDLQREEKDKIFKYELADKLGIGLTEIGREEIVNSVFEHTVNEEKLEGLSKRIQSIMNPDYDSERKSYLLKGFDFNPKSITIETAIFKKLYTEFKDKEFSKTSFSPELLKDLEAVKGKDTICNYQDEILNRKAFRKLVGKVKENSIALEYAKRIASGETEVIRDLFNEEFNRIFDSELENYHKAIKRVKSRSGNPKTIARNIDKKWMKYKENIKKKSDVFIKRIQSDFAVSPIAIISDFFSAYGVKLKVSRKLPNERFYRLESELFEKLTSFSGTKSKNFL